VYRQFLSLDSGRSHFQSSCTCRLEGHEFRQPARRPAGLHSKSWDKLPTLPDIVVTVCSSAAGEACPAYLGSVLRTHWGVDDPAHATGTDAEIDAAFGQAYRILRTRIEAFLALPLNELKNDRARLKAELDRIGSLLP
jgi:arsenate reductase